MSTVNPSLDEIISLITTNGADQLTALGTIATKQDEAFARLDFMAGQVETSTSYLGDIRADQEALDLKLGDIRGLEQQAVDLLTNIRDLLDIMNNNNSANMQQVFINWDLLFENMAANALLIKNAVCGDCGPPPLPPINDGASCRISTGGSTSTATTVSLPVVFFIGPGETARAGDTVRFRLNSITKPVVSATLYEGPSSTGTTHAIDVGGDYVEYVMPGSESTLVLVFSAGGAFNFNQTVCWVGAPS